MRIVPLNSNGRPINLRTCGSLALAISEFDQLRVDNEMIDLKDVAFSESIIIIEIYVAI